MRIEITTTYMAGGIPANPQIDVVIGTNMGVMGDGSLFVDHDDNPDQTQYEAEEWTSVTITKEAQ